MKPALSLAIALVCIHVVSSQQLRGQKTTSTPVGHVEWVGSVLKEIQTIKVGMTKNDLLKVFMPDGGLQSGTTFIYRGCPYIKVNVEFERDVITRISRPYLANPVLD